MEDAWIHFFQETLLHIAENNLVSKAEKKKQNDETLLIQYYKKQDFLIAF